MLKRLTSTVILMATLCYASFSVAQDEVMTYALAEQAIEAVEASAKENGWNLTMIVTDSAGVPVMLRRMDGASSRTYDIATRKAMTVIASGMTTGEYGAKLQAGEVEEIENGITFAGGVPVFRDGELIGAIATSGARAAEDEIASNAGVAAIGN
ncbi:MAG: heme-binding protein [Pseudohongiellaceae bacterium]|nr:heme-binding protein [Pseudohongiellaceae bacterium]